MRWNQKGMIACLILLVVVMGLLAIQSVNQKERVSEPNYASEEDLVFLPDELDGSKEIETGEAVTGTATKIYTAGTKKDTAEKKKESGKQSPQATAAVTERPDQKAKNSTSKRQEKSEKKTEKTTKDKKLRKKKNDSNEKGNSPERTALPTSAPVSGTGDAKPSQPTVHFEIQCKAILDRQDLWREGIEEIVPKSGIFYSGSCSFHEGETVYDLLKRVCQEKDIALDCSYTPIYGSYYVRGIGNLYEFDCGSESGWKYMVNGVMPGMSASQYTLQNQDKIVFVYQYEL